MGQYVVILASEASFYMPYGEAAELRFTGPPFPGASVRLYTSFVETRFQPIPSALFLECRLDAETIEAAVAAAESMTTLLLPTLGFAANATWPDPTVQIAYDVTAGVRDHELRASPRAFSRDFAEIGSRLLPIDAANAVFQAMMNNRDAIRIHRALVHYNEAIAHWAKAHLQRSKTPHYFLSPHLKTDSGAPRPASDQPLSRGFFVSVARAAAASGTRDRRCRRTRDPARCLARGRARSARDSGG